MTYNAYENLIFHMVGEKQTQM